MNENRKAPHFDKAARARDCERVEEFVAYLYGEATQEEAGVFRQHLTTCAVCREELAAFGGVREAVGEWHAEALGSLPSIDINEVLAPAREFRRPTTRKRSARAALGEFLTLSPLWLRAGALAATLIVCALAALTLARAEIHWNADGLAFRTGVTERVVVQNLQAPPAQTVYTEEQVNAVVAERLAEAKTQWEASKPRDEVVNLSDPQPGKNAPPVAARANATRPRRNAPRRLDRDEELADLPRLSDLLNGSY